MNFSDFKLVMNIDVHVYIIYLLTEFKSILKYQSK